jgi:hypothetical protein
VVSECLTRLAPDYESQRLLINYGLRETDKHVGPKAAALAAAASAAPAGGAPPPAVAGDAQLWSAGSIGRDGRDAQWWRWRRLELWQQSDRLDTIKAMSRQQQHDPAAFEAFRAAPLPAAALSLAATGNVAALAVLIQRHPAAVGPHLLRVLSALPETLDPRTYSALLPRADSGAPSGVSIPGPSTALAPAAATAGQLPAATGSGGRRTDWAELPEAYQELAAIASGGSSGSRDGSTGLRSLASVDIALHEEATALLHATEDMERAGLAAAGAATSLWPAAAGGGAWYVQRAVEIDAASGQLPHALALIDLALQRGVPPGTVAAQSGVDGGGAVTLAQLQVLGQVLTSAVRAWFPANGRSVGSSSSAAPSAAPTAATATSSSKSATGWLRARLRGRRGSSGSNDVMSGNGTANGSTAWNNNAGAGESAAGGGLPVWLLNLEELAALPLVEQLEAVLAGRSVETLGNEIKERCVQRVRFVDEH